MYPTPQNQDWSWLPGDVPRPPRKIQDWRWSPPPISFGSFHDQSNTTLGDIGH